jgi:hypothetical protein
MGAGRENISCSNYSYLIPNQNPGPGSYNADKTTTSHSNCGITIGNKTRTPCGVIFLTDKINETPGPGRYKTYKSASKGGKITSSSNRFQENRQSTPGPGYY